MESSSEAAISKSPSRSSPRGPAATEGDPQGTHERHVADIAVSGAARPRRSPLEAVSPVPPQERRVGPIRVPGGRVSPAIDIWDASDTVVKVNVTGDGDGRTSSIMIRPGLRIHSKMPDLMNWKELIWFAFCNFGSRVQFYA